MFSIFLIWLSRTHPGTIATSLGLTFFEYSCNCSTSILQLQATPTSLPASRSLTLDFNTSICVDHRLQLSLTCDSEWSVSGLKVVIARNMFSVQESLGLLLVIVQQMDLTWMYWWFSRTTFALVSRLISMKVCFLQLKSSTDHNCKGHILLDLISACGRDVSLMCIWRGPDWAWGYVYMEALLTSHTVYGNPLDVEDLRHDARMTLQEGLASSRSVSSLIHRIRSRIGSVKTFEVRIFSSWVGSLILT